MSTPSYVADPSKLPGWGMGVGGGPVGAPPPMSPVKALELKLQAYKNQRVALNEEITKLKRDLLKNPSARQKSLLNARLKMARTKIDWVVEALAATQNKYYEETGQYDKLLQGTERDAFAAVNALFKNYGLESLAGKIYEFVKNGYSADTVSILLQDTKEYKERFAGNEARIKAGLPVLSAGEYLATESSYRQIMSQAGLPKGFYDTPSDFTGWIAGNVSPSEIQQRVDLATQATILANPNYKKALNAMGIADSELTAYFLDQKKALPYVQKAAATAQIGAQALSQDLAFDQEYAESLATRGITSDQAAQGYAQVGSELTNLQGLAGIYGSEWTQRDSESAIFEGNAAAVNKKKGLASRERGNFQGSAGGARGAFAGYGGAK